MFDSSKATYHKGVVQSISETIESLIIALILAFVFRAFVVEAFVIPTGSMADTLRGAHFHLTCPTCSHQYNFGFTPANHLHPQTNVPYPTGYIPNYKIDPVPQRLRRSGGIPTCPLCGRQLSQTYPRWVKNGDRILVLKYLYQFHEPDMWDVIVFKNPTDPRENYIKRLIGRPGDTIEIIDGDVYINNQIQRKPSDVQETLWLKAFDNDYQPETALKNKSGYSGPWPQPFAPATNGGSNRQGETQGQISWSINQQRRAFEFNGSDNPESLIMDRGRLRKTTNLCAYNGPGAGNNFISTDLKLTCMLVPKGEQGQLTIKLGKYDRIYSGTINFDGTCTIARESDKDNQNGGEIIRQEKFAALELDRPVEVSFAVVDHSWRLSVGDNEIIEIGPSDPAQWGYKRGRYQLPSVELAGVGGAFGLEHIALYRDIHYTNASNGSAGRGTERNPFTLGKDEFFVMGDNSPFSHDSRFWSSPGLANGDKSYRSGIVPRDYLIGKAFFVYWPSGFRLPKISIPIIPNVGDMRFIY